MSADQSQKSDQSWLAKPKFEGRRETLPFKENFVQVPVHQRNQYQMVVKNSMGVEKRRDLTNSDLVMLNQYQYPLKEFLYTTKHY